MTEQAFHEEENTTLTNDWREDLTRFAPGYIKEWDEFKNADSPDKFFDQIKNHRSMLGQSVRIPTGEAGQEQWDQFYSKIQSKVPGLMRTPDPDDETNTREVLVKLGAPDKADDYNIAEDIGIDPETLGAYRAIAHEAGLTKKQFEKFLGKVGEQAQRQSSEATTARERDAAELKGEWGYAFPQRIEICARVAEKTGAPKGLIEAIQGGQADSQTLRWLYSLSEQFGGEGKNFTNGADLTPTPADLQSQIDDMLGNMNHPYWNSGHPGHKAAVDKMINMRRTLNSMS